MAGGQSSRMGRDKALLELGGVPLVRHAVRKLSAVCSDVRILSSRAELEEFAPLVPDLRPGCGPMGGLEAAFACSTHEWNLFLPVDMPFFPAALMFRAPEAGSEEARMRVEMYTVDGIPQPLFCLLHREVGPYVRAAMDRGDHKVFPVLEGAAQDLARLAGVPVEQVFRNHVWNGDAVVSACGDAGEVGITDAQQRARRMWFANLNTPEEFAEAERHIAALEI